MKQLNAIFKTRTNSTKRTHELDDWGGGVGNFHDRRSCEDQGKAKQAHASISKKYVLKMTFSCFMMEFLRSGLHQN